MVKRAVFSGPAGVSDGDPAVACVDQCPPDGCGVALLDLAADHARWLPTPDGLVGFDPWPWSLT